MDATELLEREVRVSRGNRAGESRNPVAKARADEQVAGLGTVYAHAFAIACEAEPRYHEFADLMADHGDEEIAALFDCLAEFEAATSFQLALNSAGVEIPMIDSREHAWLVEEPPAPGAYEFIFRMMTPRLALAIALHAEARAKTFFEHVRDRSHNALVRSLAADLASGEQAHVDWLTDALARLPQPLSTDEDHPGDPTIEQQL